MNLQLIKNFCEKRPGGVRQLAEDAQMSEPNLHRCIRNNKIQASDLERIATLLGVRVSVFFDEVDERDGAFVNVMANDHSQAAGRDITGGDQIEVQRLRDKVAYLEQRLKDKDATIAEKDMRIADKEQMINILQGK